MVIEYFYYTTLCELKGPWYGYWSLQYHPFAFPQGIQKYELPSVCKVVFLVAVSVSIWWYNVIANICIWLWNCNVLFTNLYFIINLPCLPLLKKQLFSVKRVEKHRISPSWISSFLCKIVYKKRILYWEFWVTIILGVLGDLCVWGN